MKNDLDEARGWLALERTANITAGVAVLAPILFAIILLWVPVLVDGYALDALWVLFTLSGAAVMFVAIIATGLAVMYYFRRKYGIHEGVGDAIRDNRH